MSTIAPGQAFLPGQYGTRIDSLRNVDLHALALELERRQATKDDYLSDTRRMGFHHGEVETPQGTSLLQYYLSIDNVDTDGAGFPITDYCHGQLATRLGIPKRYYDRMRETSPVLLEQNVTRWFNHEPETRMVRTLDGMARAYLSNRYRRLDDYDLMQAMLPVFNEIEGLTFHVASLTETNLYVRALLPSLQAEIRVGDIVQAGVEIRNSEVGASALQITPFLWRLVCLNGMVIPAETTRKYHTGRLIRNIQEDRSIFSDETMRLDDAAFFSSTKDILRAALSEARFETIVAGLREGAAGVEIENPVAAVERLGKTYTLAEGEQENVLTHLALGGDLSTWGAANAVTAAAKQSKSFDRQVEMEEIGGKIALLPSKEWARLANGSGPVKAQPSEQLVEVGG